MMPNCFEPFKVLFHSAIAARDDISQHWRKLEKVPKELSDKYCTVNGTSLVPRLLTKSLVDIVCA